MSKPEKTRIFKTIRDIDEALASFGLPEIAVKYLEKAVEKVSPDDCVDGRTPYFYGRVDEMASLLRRSPRTVHTAEKALEKAGLIIRETYLNGWRGAVRVRGSGEIREVSGMNLRPLIDRANELSARAEEARTQRKRFPEARNKVCRAKADLSRAIEATGDRKRISDLKAQAIALLEIAPKRFTEKDSAIDLERLAARFSVMADALYEAIAQIDEVVDSLTNSVDIADASEADRRHIYDTTPYIQYSCNENRTPQSGDTNLSAHLSVRDCLEKKSAERVDEINPEDGSTEENISIRKIDPALPDVWRHRAGPAALSWEVFCDVARVMAPELGVANHLWNRAIAHLGCERAAVALMVLDRNRERPENPVRSVGGSLNGMLEKAKVGDLNLVGSLCGIEDRDRAKLPVTLEPSLN